MTQLKTSLALKLNETQSKFICSLEGIINEIACSCSGGRAGLISITIIVMNVECGGGIREKKNNLRLLVNISQLQQAVYIR